MVTPKSFSYSGTGAVVPLSKITGVNSSRWVNLQAPTGNSHLILSGGVEVAWASDSSYTGFALPAPWSGLLYPPVSSDKFADIYDHNAIYVFVAAGDRLNGLWGG